MGGRTTWDLYSYNRIPASPLLCYHSCYFIVPSLAFTHTFFACITTWMNYIFVTEITPADSAHYQCNHLSCLTGEDRFSAKPFHVFSIPSSSLPGLWFQMQNFSTYLPKWHMGNLLFSFLSFICPHPFLLYRKYEN